MRWLLLKDLRILRRSPLLVALLVIYPAVIAVLIGFALSRGPDKPRVAFLNEVPQGTSFAIGDQRFDEVEARGELFERIEAVRVSTRAEAFRRVREGDVLGALILPDNLAAKLRSGGLEQPVVEVLVNEEDPVKARLVDDRIASLMAEANRTISRQYSEGAAEYQRLLLEGGTFSLLGRRFDVLGLQRSEKILRAARSRLPASERRMLDPVLRFSRLAGQNLSLANQLLRSVGEPIRVSKRVVRGGATPLSTFGIAVSATVTLMFVTVLLVAGSLALEREENTLARLTRGLAGRGALLAGKVLLGAVCALGVTLLMLGGLALFVNLEWDRFALWPPAIVAGGVAFGALGAAIGAAAREVRASSLLAFMLSLPIAFLGLVPSGAVSPALFDAIRFVSALFPFRATLDAMSGALHESGPALGRPLLHLAALAAAYGLLARFALRRAA